MAAGSEAAVWEAAVWFAVWPWAGGWGAPMLRRGRPLVIETSIGPPPIALISWGICVEAMLWFWTTCWDSTVRSWSRFCSCASWSRTFWGSFSKAALVGAKIV